MGQELTRWPWVRFLERWSACPPQTGTLTLAESESLCLGAWPASCSQAALGFRFLMYKVEGSLGLRLWLLRGWNRVTRVRKSFRKRRESERRKGPSWLLGSYPTPHLPGGRQVRLMSCLMKLCNPVLWEGLLGSLDPFFKNGETETPGRGFDLLC